MERKIYYPAPQCSIFNLESFSSVLKGSGSSDSGSDAGGSTGGFEWEEG